MQLNILSLNIMHARKKGRSSLPLALQKKDIARNLTKIAEEIRASDPDIVALQEVDGPSLSNGFTDHSAMIQKLAGYPFAYFAQHTKFRTFGRRNLHLAGTAIFSKYKLENSRTEFFSRTFPTPRKGYAVSDIILPGGKRITFVSTHLVFFDLRSRRSRLRQSEQIVRALSPLDTPVIVAGDFNSELSNLRERAIPTMVEKLGLQAYDPLSPLQNTFPAWKPRRRFDWVLPSKHFKFLDHQVHTQGSTDHAGVLAKLILE